MNNKYFALTKLFLFPVLLAVFSAAVSAQTTAFTYQGRLTDSRIAQPTNGAYTMQFQLVDAPTGGNSVAPPVGIDGVSVVNGVFTVELDFGASAFAGGGDRYLQVTVMETNPPQVIPLSPRQRITSVPFAVRSLNAQQLGGVAASNYVQANDSHLTNERTPAPGSNNYIQNQTAVAQAAGFKINGTADAGSLNAQTDFRIKNYKMFTLGGYQENIFGGFYSSILIGTGLGAQVNETGIENTFAGIIAGQGNIEGGRNSFFGYNAGGGNRSGSNNTAIGNAADFAANNLNYATAIGSGARVSASNTVQLGRAQGTDQVFVPGRLKVNLLGAAGTTALCRNANNEISTCATNQTAADNTQYDSLQDTINGQRDQIERQNARIEEQSRQLHQQRKEISELKAIFCALKPDAPTCRK